MTPPIGSRGGARRHDVRRPKGRSGEGKEEGSGTSTWRLWYWRWLRWRSGPGRAELEVVVFALPRGRQELSRDRAREAGRRQHLSASGTAAAAFRWGGLSLREVGEGRSWEWEPVPGDGWGGTGRKLETEWNEGAAAQGVWRPRARDGWLGKDSGRRDGVRGPTLKGRRADGMRKDKWVRIKGTNVLLENRRST